MIASTAQQESERETERAKERQRERKKEKERKCRGARLRDREHSAGSSYSRDATKISERPFRNRSARVRLEFNIEHSRPAPSRKHHADVGRAPVSSLFLPHSYSLRSSRSVCPRKTSPSFRAAASTPSLLPLFVYLDHNARSAAP